MDEIYNIVCTRKNGFFSNMFEIINILNEIDDTTVFSEVKFNNFSKNYSNTSENSYYDFFENYLDCNIKIDKINCGKTVERFLVKNNVETCDIFLDNKKLNYCNKIIEKYIKPKSDIQSIIDKYKQLNFNDKKILGVHIRRTDHEAHGNFIPINVYVSSINKIIDDYDKLFIITDDSVTLDIFKNIYGDKLLYIEDTIRSSNKMAIHYTDNDKHKIGCDVIIESYLLGSCDMIIGTSSNVLMFSLCLQKNNNFKMLDLETNRDIVFYNNFHNGDLHYSREFIKDIYNKTKNKISDFYYYHKTENPDVLFDINNNIKKAYLPNLPDSRGIYDDGRTIFINTWIGHNGMIYLTKDCSLESNYGMFRHIYEYLGIELDPIEDYIPSISFSELNNEYVNNINSFTLENKNRKKILISNGNVNSGQAQNFSFNEIINQVSSDNKDAIFICTAKSFTPINNNVLFSEDIIGKQRDDLNEISYLSKSCDVIIGRASGPYCFTHIKENLSDTEKTFISFCRCSNEGIWYQYKAKNIWSNDYDFNNIIKTINSNIK